MPLSMKIASLLKGLSFNIGVYGEGDWEKAVRTRLIDESISVLDELLLDPLFALTLQGAFDPGSGGTTHLEVLVSNAGVLDDFLENEGLLLRAAGFDNDRVEEVVGDARRVVSAGLAAKAQPTDVFEGIVRLKFSLVEARDHEVEPPWSKAVRSLATACGGAALAALNFSGFAVTLGITGPASAASAVAGAYILKEAAKGVVDLLEPPSVLSNRPRPS